MSEDRKRLEDIVDFAEVSGDELVSREDFEFLVGLARKWLDAVEWMQQHESTESSSLADADRWYKKHSSNP